MGKIGDLQISRAGDVTSLAANVGVTHRVKLGLKDDEIAYIKTIWFTNSTSTLQHAISVDTDNPVDIANFGLIVEDTNILVHTETEESFVFPEPGYKVAKDLLYHALDTFGGPGLHWVTVVFAKQRVTMKEKTELMVNRR